MTKAHYVAIKDSNGTPIFAPLKAWLRDNPSELPAEVNASEHTTYQLRRALKHKGWEMEELADRTVLIKPDQTGDTSFADELLEDVSQTEESKYEEKVEEAAEVTFGLERDLQAALRSNIGQLEAGLIVSDSGKERNTEAGRIDVTAKDQTGRLVVIELKAGTAMPDVIAQILAYMGAVSEEDGKPVRGILVAGDFHKKVIWASRAIPNLELRKYSFKFAFEKIE